MGSDTRKIDARALNDAQFAQQVRRAMQEMPRGTIEVTTRSSVARNLALEMAQEADWQTDVRQQVTGEFKITLRKV